MAAIENQNEEKLKEIGTSAEKALSDTLTEHKRDHKWLQNDLDSAVAKLQHVSRPAEEVESGISLLDTQVRHIKEATELLDYVSAFSSLPKVFANDINILKQNSSGLPSILRDEYDHSAQVMAKLRKITKGLEGPILKELGANVCAYSDVIEEDLLLLFEEAVQKEPRDIGTTKRFVDAIFVLNGGAHIPGRYAFIVVSSKLNYSADDGNEDNLKLVFDRMKAVCLEEFDFIHSVFSPLLAPRVTTQLFQLVLSDPVHGIIMRLERTLSPPPPLGPRLLPDSLNLLSIAVKTMREVFDALKGHNLLTERKDNTGTKFCGDKDKMLRSQPGISNTIASRWHSSRGPSLLMVDIDFMMQQALMDLRSGYPNSEIKSLLQNLLKQYESIWKGALEYDMFQGMGRGEVLHLDGFPAIVPERIQSFEMLLSGPLQENVINHVLSSLEISIRRCRMVMISDQEEEGELIGGLWASASRYISSFLVGPCVSAALQLVSKLESDKKGRPLTWESSRVSVPPLAFYEVISACNAATRALQAHFTSIVLPAVDYTPTQRTVVTETTKTHIDRIDGLLSLSIQRVLEIVSEWVGQHFSKKRSAHDYAVKKAKGPSIQPAEATACMIRLCKVVKEQYGFITKYLPEMDMSGVWSTFGLSIVQMFMDYIKSSKVTETGGFILAHDLNEMQDMLRLFDSTKVGVKMKQLHSIVNLYIIPAEKIKGLVEGDKVLSEMSKSELKEYLKQRADWQNSIGILSSWAKEFF